MLRNTFSSLVLAGGLALAAGSAVPARAADTGPIKIGLNAAIQLQVGRDIVDAATLAVNEINAKGGVLGRKLELVVADETVDPQQGVAAINKLTSDDHVNVLIGGYSSGVQLAQLPHIARSKTVFLDVGSASPSITDFVRKRYDQYKYIFRVNPLNSAHQADQLVGFVTGKLKPTFGIKKIAVVGENAKWVQGLVPVLVKGVEAGGVKVAMQELFDPDMADFSPIFAKVKSSGAQYMLVILSHANSDVFVKQWYDSKLPIPIGGIDVKSQDPDFFKRIGGKAISEVSTNSVLDAPLTPKTVPFWKDFTGHYHRAPVYTAPGAYDAVHIYAEAVERAKSTAADKIIPVLEKTKYVGTQGTYVFDKQHDVEPGPGRLNLLFVQWQDGGKRVVVWPKSLANGKMILPPWMNGQKG